MSDLDDVVRVIVSKETTNISTTGFGIPLALVDTASFVGRTKEYASTVELREDFGVGSSAYRLTSNLFSGTNKPTKIVVGRRATSTVTYEVDINRYNGEFIHDGSIPYDIVEGSTFVLNVNGNLVSYMAQDGDEEAEIVAGLKVAFDALDILGITFTANAGAFTLLSADPTEWYTKPVIGLYVSETTSNESWVDAFLDSIEDNGDWYAMVAETHDKDDIKALAQTVETTKKIYGTSTQSVVDTASDSGLIYELSQLGYDRTFILFSVSADTEYPESVWIGDQLPLTPGSNNWNFKRSPGVTVGKVGTTAKNNILRNNGNLVQSKAGVNYFSLGTMVSGEFIDITIFIDWWVARVQESVFLQMINKRKIPMTSTGITMIQSEIMSVNALGIANGGIADDTPPRVIPPTIAGMSQQQRASRSMGDFKVIFRLAGAVNSVTIDATITV